jgi:hypothetical protein
MLEAKPKAVPGTVVLAPEHRDRIRVLIDAVGVREASRLLGVSAPTLTTGIAGLPLRRGWAALLERYVDAPRAA